VPYNLLQYSEAISTSPWGNQGTPIITINDTTAPNGTLTADKITNSNSANFVRQTVNLVIGQVYTASVYIKNIDATQSILFIRATASNLNLVITWSGNDISSTNVGTFENVGDGWYRVQASFTALEASALYRLYNVNTTESSYLWGAQLVQGTSALDYQSTETRLNIPRLDYSLGSCPNILLEPQRTNIILSSEEFENVWWGKTRATITANSVTSPSGVQNADTLEANATGAGSSVSLFGGGFVTVVSGTRYTVSVYVKKGNQDWFIFNIGNLANTNYSRQWFNISNGTLGNAAIVGAGLNAQSATIEDVGDGWYRCSFSIVADDLGFRGGFTLTNANSAFSATIGDTMYLWGAQLEVGAYATSYIPTTSASVTRNQDVISRGNIFTNGLITASGGTWFIDFRSNLSLLADAAGDFLILGVSQSLTDNNLRILGSTGTANRLFIFKRIGGVNTSLYTTTTDTAKIAFKWNGSTLDVFVNGVKVVAATAYTETAMQNIFTDTKTRKYINSMALFPTPITDGECSMLTSGVYTPALAYAQLGLVSESPACLDSSVNALL
jgi:hypothetical protein